MCGIAGFSGDFRPDILTLLGGGIAHRGPDDEGQVAWPVHGGLVGLQNRRLAILDLSAAGHQPMTAQCPRCAPPDAAGHARVWITYNGEIYNFPELRAELERAGHHFVSHSDTELLLHLYAVDGPDMLRRLNGMFALALYDGRPRGQRPGGLQPGDLLLARDGIGIKPLYYSESRRGVLFASELKALLRCDASDVPRRLDPVAVSQYLAYQWVPAPRTVLESVRKVLPGEWLLVRGGRIHSRHTFYSLPAQDPSAAPLEVLSRGLRDTLASAVSRQMLADVPVGAFLSGGLDSSAVVAMARRARPGDRLPCYTMAFSDDFRSEGSESDFPYAQQAARYLDVDLIPVRAGADVATRLDEVLYALDEPTGDPAPINAYLIAEQARRDGVKVLLSGAGGDDILGGYGRHRWLSLERIWDGLPLPLRHQAAALARGRAGEQFGMRSFAARRLIRLLRQLDLPRDQRLAERLQTTAPGLRSRLLHPSISERLPADSDAEPLLETLAALPRSADPLTMMLRLEQRHFLADHNLNYLDKTTMAFGVEGRVPLVDLELVAFAARVPTRLKVRRTQPKFILRKAMEGVLPRAITERSKTGFGVPLRCWMTRDLREQVRDVLSPAALRARGVFDPAAVQALMDRTDAGTADGTYPLFSVLAFELWCRRFLV